MMAHRVSQHFLELVAADVKSPQPGCLISWKKTISPDVKFFTLDQSKLDGGDKLMGSDSSSITFFDKFYYNDETANVKNFRVTKKISNKPWGVIMATAEIELNNTSKRYFPNMDPEIGEYVALPNLPIKLSMGLDGEFIKLFTGFTEMPNMNLVKRTLTLKAYDCVAYLATVKSNLPAFVNTDVRTIIEQLLVEQGFGYSQFSIEPGLQTSIGYLPCNGRKVSDILEDICEAEGYTILADEDGKILGWNRNHLSASSMDPQWDFFYSNMTDLQWSSSNILNSVRVTAIPYKPVPWNKIWELDGASDQTLVQPGQSIDIFAEFKDYAYKFYAISVDTPKYVTNAGGSSSFLTNTAMDGNGAPNAGEVVLQSYYNFGDTYKMTFKNNGSTALYVTKITLFGQPAKVSAVKSSLHEKPASISKYGINPNDGYEIYEVENNLIQDTAMADAYAEALVSNYSEPQSQLEISNFPVPHLQFGDSVLVNIADTEQVKLCLIFGYEIFFGVDVNLTHKILVETRGEAPDIRYFILDKSHLDGGDILAL
jgi:hypothetical protein